MNFSPEIKGFTQNTLTLSIVFLALMSLGWIYLIRPMMGEDIYATPNAATFRVQDTVFLGGFATALSMNIGLGAYQADRAPVELSTDTITIAEALSNTQIGARSLITENMNGIIAYENILAMDIHEMLDQSLNRQKTIDAHIALLKSYGARGKTRIEILTEQIADLRALTSENTSEVNLEKEQAKTSYQVQDGINLESSIDRYIRLRQDGMKAQTYLPFLEKFRARYAELQDQNALILDTLVQNREAIIQNTQIIVPNSGTEVLKKLKLIRSEG